MNCTHCGEEELKTLYVLRHDIPEIQRGAIVEYNEDRNRYEVINLSEVARYPLTTRSRFSFHADIVESSPYWFENLED